MSKVLVAYFSASGTTRNVAERIAKAAKADLFEIKPAVPYTHDDLDWTSRNSRSSIERDNPACRPEIVGIPANMDAYEVVLIGFPIWWYAAPAIVSTFLESCDFSGKTIIPFATSGGSGMGKTTAVLKPLCAASAKWGDGKILNHVSDKELEAWLRSIL